MGFDKEAILKATDIAGLVCELLPQLKPVGADQALVCCVYHDDHNPSMSVNLSTGLHNCRGCGKTGTVFDLVMAVKGLSFAGACQWMAERAGLKEDSSPPKFKVTGKHPYHHADGTLAYWKERVEPGFHGRSKDFLFFHGEGIKPGQGFYLPKDKKEKHKGRGCDPLPYRLPDLLQAAPDAPVFVPEGEKKADLLASWGLVATCLDSGAQTKPYPSFVEVLKNRRVVILPDNDEPGEKYATTVAGALYGVAASVKIVRLPGLPAKGDILDWAGAKA